ncbi:MAG TPA: AAA family ATPase [Actinomycetota bacterium]|nr:AAA family ATPase [Actinomycetota bacterium]
MEVPTARRTAGPTDAPTRASSPSLVGRDRELGLLLDTVASPPAVVVIEGEPGIGKTRLVQEAVQAVDPLPTLLGRCHDLREPFPLGPVVEALRGCIAALPRDAELTSNAGALHELLPELAERLPPAPPRAGTAAASRHRVFRAIRELLERIGPCLLVLEDLHWADRSTADLLRFLVPDMPEGLAICLTYRPDDLPSDLGIDLLRTRLPRGVLGATIGLRPLSREEVGALVSAILEVDHVSPAFAGYLHERSDGLPLAVEELIRLLRDRRDIVRQGGAWARRAIENIALPDALRGLVLERLGRLSREARLVVEAAAILGDAADEGLLGRVSRLSPGPRVAALSEGVEAGLLEDDPPGSFDVRHSLTREAIEAVLPSPRRRELHLRAAEALEEQDPPPFARIARHFGEAGRTAELVDYAEKAAGLALERGDDATAVRVLADALRVENLDPETRARLGLQLATAALHALAHVDAIPLLEAILRDDLPPDRRGELRLALGRLLVQAGRGADAEIQFELAVEELRHRPDFVARALANLALPTTLEPKASHLRWAERAVEVVEATPDPATRAAVVGDRAATLLYLGHRDAWRAIDDLPPPGPGLEQRRELVRVLHNLAEAALYLGHYDRARRFAERCAELAGELRYERFASHLQAIEIALAWAQGAWVGLDERATELSASAASAGPAADADLVRGLLSLVRGSAGEARDLLASVAETAELAAWLPLLTAARAGLARLALMRADPETAMTEVGLVLDAIRRKGVWAWAGEMLPVAVEAQVHAGDVAAAERLVAEAALGIRGGLAVATRAAVTVSRGMIAEVRGDLDASERGFAAAEKTWQQLGRPYDATRAHAARGNVLLLSGRRAGRDLLISALEDFERLGAAWDAGRLRAMLRRHGISAPRAGGRPAYGRELSPREREVAELVSEGRTNREIAEALFVSTRTVEFHVANLLRKLDVTNRTALALALRSPQRAEKTP